jgi:methionyl aminopeptidase
MGIVIKNLSELRKMREAGRVVAAVLGAVEAACVPGLTTKELEQIAARELAKGQARSAYLGYRMGGAPPYREVLCTSVNRVVVHGIPSAREVLREGDIIGIDFACYKDDFCADGARTIAVGVISAPARALIEATRAALARAIAECVPGRRIGDLGATIEASGHVAGYGVVRDFVGHGIGRRMHEPPSVPNFGRAGHGARLKPGMTIAIEPMLNAGTHEIRVLDDGWTVVTADDTLSAHFEHTVAITDDGPQILTAA